MKYSTGILKAWMGGLMASVVFSAAAFAGSVHIPGNKVSFADIGVQLETSLKLAGLGNGDVTIQVQAEGLADVAVLNPGNNQPPGQQVGVTAAGTQTIPSDQIKNGTVTVSLTTEPVDEADVVVDLPNPNWDVEIEDVEFEVVTIKVIQNGEVVLEKSYVLL